MTTIRSAWDSKFKKTGDSGSSSSGSGTTISSIGDMILGSPASGYDQGYSDEGTEEGNGGSTTKKESPLMSSIGPYTYPTGSYGSSTTDADDDLGLEESGFTSLGGGYARSSTGDDDYTPMQTVVTTKSSSEYEGDAPTYGDVPLFGGIDEAKYDRLQKQYKQQDIAADVQLLRENMAKNRAAASQAPSPVQNYLTSQGLRTYGKDLAAIAQAAGTSSRAAVAAEKELAWNTELQKHQDELSEWKANYAASLEAWKATKAEVSTSTTKQEENEELKKSPYEVLREEMAERNKRSGYYAPGIILRG